MWPQIPGDSARFDWGIHTGRATRTEPAEAVEQPASGAARFAPSRGLAGGPRGTLAVVELAKIGWLKWELSGQPAVGSLFLQFPGQHHRAGYKKELARGKLFVPSGTAFSKWGDIYVTSPIFGPGSVSKVRL